MAKRTYTDEQRVAALAVLRESSLADAWRATGVPKPTLADWARKAGVRTYGLAKTEHAIATHTARAAELRSRVRLKLLEKADDLLDRMDAPHVEFKGKDADQVTYPIAPAGAVQNYATSVGILIDKYRLEIGEATARSEVTDLTHDDHERAVLRDVLRSEIARRHSDRPATAPPQESAVVDVGSPEPAGTER